VQAGDLIGGRFRLEHHVGTGGMGVVFRALDESSGRAVAIKLLETRDVTDRERAHREAEALARLAHPAIVAHVADGTTETGQVYLAMEWIDGTTVANRMTGIGFTLREAVALGRGIADALAAAHEVGVLHRDVKPSNVLLAGDDAAAAKLIDFGVARMVDASHAITRTGAAIGTPGYMSPEQARGERALAPAADVFGLGCLLYECATGRPAFSGTAAAAVLAKILFAEPASLADLCPEAPAALSSLVARMLAKDSAQRIRSCRDVGAALDQIGEIPEGPRRSSRELVAEPTLRSPASGSVHCIVAAASGRPDDILPPPSDDEIRALRDAAEHHGARLEILATGAIFAYLEGGDGTARRAASLACAMRAISKRWSIVVAADRDPAAMLDDGAARLGTAALAAIFRRDAAITVDAALVPVLRDEFELAPADAGTVKLIGRRAEP
jgi:serine/threonine protein kinase